MSYVFWCSNCKVRHAGECPPARHQVGLPPGDTVVLASKPNPNLTIVVHRTGIGRHTTSTFPPGSAACDHDWSASLMADFTVAAFCRKCSATKRELLLDVIGRSKAKS